MAKSKIVNVVATASLDQRIDFENLRKHKGISHDSDVYGGRVAYFKTSGMEGKVSIFNSGKMISVGTKSEAQAFEELQMAEEFLFRKGLTKQVKLQSKTRNIVVLTDLEKGLSLKEFSQKWRANYEPEQFPGAILRLNKPFKTCFLIFSSGKVVITGLKGSDQIEPTVQHLIQLIESDL